MFEAINSDKDLKTGDGWDAAGGGGKSSNCDVLTQKGGGKGEGKDGRKKKSENW